MDTVIERIDRGCKECFSYTNCKDLEVKYKERLVELEGNWRPIYENGTRVGTPIRRCSRQIFSLHKDRFVNKTVLEVGCGPLGDFSYEFCKENNVDYIGLEPERPPTRFWQTDIEFFRKVQNRLVKTFIKFPFGKKYRLNKNQKIIVDFFPSKEIELGTVDAIYGNSTIEHWHEDVDDIEKSIELYENDVKVMYDLLSEGGSIVMNCPILVHGNVLFIRGHVEKIKKLFLTQPWSEISFEHWRDDHADLAPYCQGTRKEHFKESFGIDLENMWILNVVAKK
jgi:hypothetical protein